MKKLNFLFLLLMCLFTYQAYSGQNFTVTTCSTGIGSNTYGPMNSNSTANSKNRTAFILPASQLSALSGGTITSTYFRRIASSGSLPAGTTFKIYLKLTSATDFGSTSPDWATEISTATLVYDSDPATAVGSTAGFKQFLQSSGFTYTSGNNLAVYLEYTQTTAPSSSITWDYEYGTTCISTGNNNTTKYLNTTSAFTSTLTSSNYRRPVIGFDVTFPAPVSAPACTTVSSPAANATGVSVTPTFTWAGVLGQNGASSYLINLGTSPGATNVMNGVDVGNVTSYTVPASSPLNFNQQYYIKVIPKNSIGSATGCTETSFTTANISCPSVSAPASAATGVSLTPTITWAATTGALGYRISMGTTSGGTDVLNNVDVGNVTTYTLNTTLNTSTTYYYTVNAYSAGSVSSSCTIRNFTTVCGAFTPNYTNNFSTFPGVCWSRANGGTPATGPGTGTTNYWLEDGFLNVGSTGAAKINLYSTARNGWLISPSFNLSAGGYRVKFDYGVTAYSATTSSAMGSDDVVQFVVSTDGGTTWTVLQTWNASNAPTNTLNSYTLNLTAYTGNNVIFAMFGSDGTVDDTQDYEFFVDNFTVESIPSCDTPAAVNVSSITNNSATLSWTAPATPPANGYEYYYSTTNTAPASGTPTSAISVPLSSLTPLTTYYYWVRSMCAGTQSTWVTGSFTTLATPPANDNCSSPVSLTAGGNFAQNPVVGTTVGATLTNDATATTACQTTRYADTWYSVVVPASGSIKIETKAVTGSSLNDTVLGVYSGSCGALTPVGCNDDDGDGNFSLLSLTAANGITPGETLLIGVWNYSSSNNGQFQISAYDSSLTLATNEVKDIKNTIKVYPNPFSEILNISDAGNVKNVLVVDLAGRLVKTIANPSSVLQLGELKEGLYVVTLEMKDGSKQSVKVIKK
ncbi:T9SS type A sorting domain-containing protein [uncultured Chryseobacterium sp.]|uniref:T9SS type A sorting domain-containing protein n=1 Tax=uncultured Chryseobacterium sp. TaxID=259322 RepID=UPI00260048A9|nr:T9SS type A sorting domain-containing protein [uncultured Chryseobacterium sp.]